MKNDSRVLKNRLRRLLLRIFLSSLILPVLVIVICHRIQTIPPTVVERTLTCTELKSEKKGVNQYIWYRLEFSDGTSVFVSPHGKRFDSEGLANAIPEQVTVSIDVGSKRSGINEVIEISDDQNTFLSRQDVLSSRRGYRWTFIAIAVAVFLIHLVITVWEIQQLNERDKRLQRKAERKHNRSQRE